MILMYKDFFICIVLDTMKRKAGQRIHVILLLHNSFT